MIQISQGTTRAFRFLCPRSRAAKEGEPLGLKIPSKDILLVGLVLNAFVFLAAASIYLSGRTGEQVKDLRWLAAVQLVQLIWKHMFVWRKVYLRSGAKLLADNAEAMMVQEYYFFVGCSAFILAMLVKWDSKLEVMWLLLEMVSLWFFVLPSVNKRLIGKYWAPAR